MELRGFDSYEVTLGDELRGERACRGWTLRDAARELAMKPSMIEAIENADLSAFPNRSVVPGYVRSYARYLGLDGDEVYARFCAESGFESTLVSFGMMGETQEESRTAMRLSGAVGADLTASRFAVRPAPRRIGATVSLGGLVSALALTVLLGGVGYGGYTVLQDIQRVGFVPLPEAPAVVADAPEIDAPIVEPSPVETMRRPTAADYADGGALFGLARAGETPAGPGGRDGPISAIDPASAGILRVEPAMPEPALGLAAAIAEARAGLPDAARDDLADAEGPEGEKPVLASADTATPAPPSEAEPVAEGPRGIVVMATEPAWIRVRAGDSSVLFEGTLQAGDSFALPGDAGAAQLRAGNAGGVFIGVDGRRYGPLGRAGQVVKRVALERAEITAAYAPAEAAEGTPDLATAARTAE